MNVPLDPVRTRTAADVLRRIDEATLSNLVDEAESSAPDIAQRLHQRIRQRADADVTRLEGAPRDVFERRLRELEAEWDIERVLQLNASVLALSGLALGRFVDRRFLALPALVFSFFAQHALQGWCPPVLLFRRLGVRTAREIERERYAVKALRGDFDDVPAVDSSPPDARARAALRAVDR